MCIQTADVNAIICLIFEKINELIENGNYGIDCNNSNLTQLMELKKIYEHIKFQCYSTDYIRNYVLTNANLLPEACERIIYIDSVPR